MKVVAADSRQIEARVLAWVAGHDELVQQFARSTVDANFDIYSEQGSKYFGETISKETHPDERQTSKNLTLGSGFQLGWFRLAIYMLQGMNGSKPQQFTEAWAERLNVDVLKFMANEEKLERVKRMPSRLPLEERIIHCAVSDHFIRQYRSENRPITEFWDLMGGVIEAMDSIEPDREVAFGTADCLKVKRHGIVLPNGLLLRYPGLRQNEEGEWSYMGGPVGKERRKLYGGLMTENVVQALARVVVAQQMLTLAEMGWKPKAMTHDEIVYVVKDAEVERCMADCLAVMRTPPPWAPGLPLDTEVKAAQTYGGAK